MEATGLDLTGSTAWNEDNPMSLIPTVVLMANDTTPIRSLSFTSLYLKNWYDYGLPNDRIVVDAATDTSFKAVGVMDFRADVKDELDLSMIFPAHKFGSLKLQFQVAPTTSFTDAIVAYGTVTISITLICTKNNPTQDKWDIHYVHEHPVTISAIHPQYEPRDIEAMGFVIRRLFMITRDNSLRSDALLTNLKIRDNVKEYEPYVSTYLKTKDRDILDYRLIVQQAWDGAAMIPIYDPLAGFSTIPGTIKGIAVIDFDRNVNMTAWYPTQGYTKGNLQLQYINIAPTGVATLTYILEYLRNEKLS